MSTLIDKLLGKREMARAFSGIYYFSEDLSSNNMVPEETKELFGIVLTELELEYNSSIF